ncbi:helix-turn-helix domain-containing protein [Roseibium alexandrii]|uniref:Plasmid maintenance system antidote protein n=1 Tax=Roseibium alexandrii (strain DSM 17067 / NCIMB 14079 / DFL-11) TaxID=244592 RepID=A0A5E8GW38_ROSAD|nr:helix-turn-helix transcriptional regulator [Roseibium alexandrii]EEE44164.2 Plasmid maintenance system antidote protein [Roseibium alexandrii DFL-11]
MTIPNRQADIASDFDFSNIHNGNYCAEIATDRLLESVHYSHAMATDKQDIIKQWLAKVIEEKEETQAGLAKLLGLSTSQINKTVSGSRNLKADELLIVAAYFDADLPIIPGYGHARIAKRSNDNLEGQIAFSDSDEDELWNLAEQKVKDEENKRGIKFTNEEFIDRIIKLYNTLSRRHE